MLLVVCCSLLVVDLMVFLRSVICSWFVYWLCFVVAIAVVIAVAIAGAVDVALVVDVGVVVVAVVVCMTCRRAHCVVIGPRRHQFAICSVVVVVGLPGITSATPQQCMRKQEQWQQWQAIRTT